MGAAVVSFRAEVRILESGSVRMNNPQPWVDVDAPDSSIVSKSGDDNDQALCDEAVCDVGLLSAAQSGDQHAFVELCRRHSPYLKRRIHRIVRNFEDTEDLLQETLMSAFKHLAGFRGNCSFRTWITTIATNKSLMLLRKRRNHPETGFGIVTAEGQEFEILQLSDPLPNPEQVYAKRQTNHRVAQAVRKLPPGFRLIVERYHQDEGRLVDAAKAMGITESTAKSRLFRARRVLRRNLKDDGIRYVG